MGPSHTREDLCGRLVTPARIFLLSFAVFWNLCLCNSNHSDFGFGVWTRVTSFLGWGSGDRGLWAAVEQSQEVPPPPSHAGDKAPMYILRVSVHVLSKVFTASGRNRMWDRFIPWTIRNLPLKLSLCWAETDISPRVTACGPRINQTHHLPCPNKHLYS